MSANKKTLIDGDFQVGSGHFIVDTENNYVGFNNSVPQNKIDVQIGPRTGTHSTNKPLYVTGVTSTSGAEFVSDDGTTGIGIGSSNIFTTETNQNLVIAPDGTGAVGIKTDPNPLGETFSLWVQGDANVTGNVTANQIYGDGSGLTNVPGTQWVTSSEDIYFLNNTGSGEGKVGIGKIGPEYKLDILDSDKPTIRVKSTSTGDGDALLILDSSATGESDIEFKHDGTLNWRIRTGDATPSGTTFQLNNANDSPVITTEQNGNVGIGTATPNVPLEVKKTAGGELFRLTNGTSTLYAGADADPPWFGTSSDDHLRLVTNGTEKIRIESGGNVGIGTTNPGTALDVVGTVTASSFSGIQVGDVPTLNQNTTGSAATLTTARTIGGVSFNGGANITLPGVNAVGNQNTTGSAATLTTARTIGGVSFNGGADITPTTFAAASFSGDVAFDTDTLFVDVNANRVGIGKTNPGTALDVVGTVTATSFSGIQESDVPALSAYATTTALSDGLATKQASGSYATTTALSDGLATKQASGSYATTTALSDGLATKQASGSYATTTALSDGLATKQASGSYATTTALSDGLATKQASGSYATTTALSDGLATKQASGSYAPTASPTFTGNVGIGTSDPNHKLEVSGGILADYIAIHVLNLHGARFGKIIEYRYSGMPSSAPTDESSMNSEFGNRSPTATIYMPEQMRYPYGSGATNIAHMWIGIIQATSTGVYTFGVNSDDAGDLFVAGYRVADWYAGHGHNTTITIPGGNQRTIYLKGGEWYKVKARFEENAGGEAFFALWKKPGDTSFSEIPSSNLGYLLGDTPGNVVTSDDRLKVNETIISNATDTIIKLKPQIYDKFESIQDVHDTKNQPIRESGLIAQDIWYDTPELRHMVYPYKTPNETRQVNEDIQQDPDYSDWGPVAAQVNYFGVIPYLIKSFQELHEKVIAEKVKTQQIDADLQAEKVKTQQMEARLSLLESTLASLIS